MIRPRLIVSILFVALLSATAVRAGDDQEKKRAKSRKMAAETLEELNKLQPTSKDATDPGAAFHRTVKVIVNPCAELWKNYPLII